LTQNKQKKFYLLVAQKGLMRKKWLMKGFHGIKRIKMIKLYYIYGIIFVQRVVFCHVPEHGSCHRKHYHISSL